MIFAPCIFILAVYIWIYLKYIIVPIMTITYDMSYIPSYHEHFLFFILHELI